jgi:hypothetical protein
MFHVPNKYRISKEDHPMLGSDSSYGNSGAFRIPIDKNILAFVIASDGGKWEHVSVHIVEDGKNETPAWEEMCKIKEIFWDEEDCVIQYHPAKSEYVNNHKHTLHLWRPVNIEIPIPPSIMVGVK